MERKSKKLKKITKTKMERKRRENGDFYMRE